MNLIINTDGASRGNPGPASYGYVIKSTDGVILHQEGKTLGITTNNVAEYTGVLSAFEYIRDHFSHKAPHHIKLLADSKLVIEQLCGRYKIKNPTLRKIFDQIKILEMEFDGVDYEHVYREHNFIADRLANKALDNERDN